MRGVEEESVRLSAARTSAKLGAADGREIQIMHLRKLLAIRRSFTLPTPRIMNAIRDRVFS